MLLSVCCITRVFGQGSCRLDCAFCASKMLPTGIKGAGQWVVLLDSVNQLQPQIPWKKYVHVPPSAAVAVMHFTPCWGEGRVQAPWRDAPIATDATNV